MKMSAPRIAMGKFGRSNLVVLAASNAGSLLSAASLVLSLHPEDKVSIKLGCSLTLLGVVYFVSLFDLLNAWFLCTAAGITIRNKYTLSVADVLDINNKAVSAVQAIFCFVTGVIVCSYSCPRDFLRTSHYMSEAYAWFGAAYFFYDIWSMYMVHVYQTGNLDTYFRPRATIKKHKHDVATRSGDSTATKPRPSFLQYCCYDPVILFHHLFIGGYGFLIIVVTWLMKHKHEVATRSGDSTATKLRPSFLQYCCYEPVILFRHLFIEGYGFLIIVVTCLMKHKHDVATRSGDSTATKPRPSFLQYCCYEPVILFRHLFIEGYGFLIIVVTCLMKHKHDVATRSGDSTATKPRPSFLQYCCYDPVILFHHLFIGGYGFLIIVVTWLMKHKHEVATRSGDSTATKLRPSFLQYCCYEPVILFRHLFIEGYGFLIIVVTCLMKHKHDVATRSGDSTATKPRPSFLQYCCYEPVILFHHLFIGGYGFLIIVVTCLMKHKHDVATRSGDSTATKPRPSFLQYCCYDPVILFHHLFIGGYGFLIIVVTCLMKHKHDVATRSGDSTATKPRPSFLQYCCYEPVILFHHLFIGGYSFLIIVVTCLMKHKHDVATCSGDSTATKPQPSFLRYCCYDPVILFHHLFIGGYGFLIIVYLRGGLGDCVFGWVYIMELSTPFVSLRGILSRLGLKQSRAYVCNGLIMLATFGVCRVCSMPYVLLHYSRVVNKPYIEAISTLPTGCKISILILLLPQLYWFILMSFGAVKVLRQPSGSLDKQVKDSKSS